MVSILKKIGFEYTESEIQDVANKHDISFVSPSKKQMLTAWDIENLGNLFIPVFKANDGGKYYFTLALSSHLSHFIQTVLDAALCFGFSLIGIELIRKLGVIVL